MSAVATGLAIAVAGVSGAQADGSAERLSAAQLAGQKVVAGYAGLEPPAGLIRRIRRGEVGGVVLFSQNIASRSRVAQVTRRLQRVRRPAAVDVPLLVMVDQEGGPVRRIPGAPVRSAADVGADGRSSAARADGRAAGRNLRGAGVNVDLAPVADVARPGSAMERERRSYGRRASKVARLAGEFAAGLLDRGVQPTAKHFPGFGAAGLNTDNARVTINVSRPELRSVDERPYPALFRRGVRMVMLSTAIYPALDGTRPAAFSRKVATRELRGHLNFKGVSATDALGTPATAPFGSPAAVGVRAARAGVDLLLYVSYDSGVAAVDELAKAIRRGRISRKAAERSVGRVLDLRSDLR